MAKRSVRTQKRLKLARRAKVKQIGPVTAVRISQPEPVGAYSYGGQQIRRDE